MTEINLDVLNMAVIICEDKCSVKVLKANASCIGAQELSAVKPDERSLTGGRHRLVRYHELCKHEIYNDYNKVKILYTSTIRL